MISLEEIGRTAFYVAVVLVVIISGIGLSAWQTVDAGERKVVTDRGAVTGEILEPGWHIINPITEGTKSVSVRPQEYTMSKTINEGNRARDDQVDVLTNDGLEVGIDITVRYSISEDKADVFYTEYRTISQSESRLIRPTIRAELRTVAGNLDTGEIYTADGQRELQDSVRDTLKTEFNGSGLVLNAVQIRAVDLPQDYKTSIEQKEVAKQKIEQEQAEIDRAELEKERKRIEAEADAQQNRILSQSLTQEVLTERYIEAIDGNSKIIMTGGNGGGGGTPVILDIQDTQDGNDVDLNSTDAGQAETYTPEASP